MVRGSRRRFYAQPMPVAVSRLTKFKIGSYWLPFFLMYTGALSGLWRGNPRSNG